MSTQPTAEAGPAELMTRAEAAKYLRLTTGALSMQAKRKQGPAYVVMGTKSIRYRKADLDAWIAARTVVPGSPAA